MNDTRAIAAEFDNLDDFFAVEDTLFLVRSTLRKAIGKNLNIAMAMPSDATEGVSVNVAFKGK